MTASKVGRNFQKLMIKFTNAPVLDEVLFLQKTLIESVAKMQKSILESSRAVMRWGQTESNCTFSDVLSNWFDLDNALWMLLQDLQNECLKYRQVYKGIKEEERILCELGKRKESKTNEVNRLRSKVNALKKAGTKKAERLDTTEAELQSAEQEERRLDDELNTSVTEFEKSKARIIKDALDAYSQGWITFAKTSLDIFGAQSQIAQEMPKKPVMFEDQITDDNQLLVKNIFEKLNLQKPDREIKPEREIRAEVPSPHSRRPTLEGTSSSPNDHPRHGLFGSLGNNIGAKLSKFSHKSSKECLAEEHVSNARPLPNVPPRYLEEDEFDDDFTGDDYTALNDSNTDDENYVIPNLSSCENDGRQYTFLKKDLNQPRLPPGMSHQYRWSHDMDQPRFPPGMSHDIDRVSPDVYTDIPDMDRVSPDVYTDIPDMDRVSPEVYYDIDQPRFPPVISYQSSSDVTEEAPSDDEPYLAVISDREEDVNENVMVYEDLQPAVPPPRPPKNIPPDKPAFLSPPSPAFSRPKKIPIPAERKPTSNGSPPVSPDLPKPEKISSLSKPKITPRPKRPPPTLPRKVVSLEY